MNLHDAQHFFYRLCGDYPLSYEDIARELAPASAAHLNTQSDERKAIYRRLVYTSTADILTNAMPVFFALLGADKKEELIRTFLHLHKPRTPFYRDIPRDFSDFLHTSAFADAAPFPFLPELADYELCDYALLFRNNDTPPAHNADCPLEKAVPVVNPHLYLKQYRHPVHRLGKESDPATVSPSVTSLVLFRHPLTFKIDTLELDTFESGLLASFLAHAKSPFGAHLDRLHAAPGEKGEDAFTAKALATLRTFLDKKIVLAML